MYKLIFIILSFSFIFTNCSKEKTSLNEPTESLKNIENNNVATTRSDCNDILSTVDLTVNSNNTITVNTNGLEFEKISIHIYDSWVDLGDLCDNYNNDAIPSCDGGIYSSALLPPGKYRLKLKLLDETKCYKIFNIGYFGFVKYYEVDGNPLDNVLVTGTKNQSEVFSTLTNLDIPYNWGQDNDNNSSLDIKWSYDEENWRDGLGAIDIHLLQKHIDGIQPFTTLQQYIAADVNADGNVDSDDVELMKKMFFFIIDEYPTIVSGAQHSPITFIYEDDFNGFQELIDDGLILDNTGQLLQIIQSSYNFSGKGEMNAYAVKRGDVNGSWTN